MCMFDYLGMCVCVHIYFFGIRRTYMYVYELNKNLKSIMGCFASNEDDILYDIL